MSEKQQILGLIMTKISEKMKVKYCDLSKDVTERDQRGS